MNERRPIYGGGYGGFGGYPGYGFGGYGGFGGYPGYGFGGGYGYPGYGFGGYGGYGGFGGFGGFGDIRGTVLAAMAEATRSIIIGKANISDHSGKSTLGTARVFFVTVSKRWLFIFLQGINADTDSYLLRSCV